MVLHFRPSPDAVAQRVGDEIVLVHLTSDRIFALNRTGARIWELLGEDCNRADMQRRLLKEFDVSESELGSEIDSLLKKLQNEEFIQPKA
jgi:hypothetical protein